VFTGPAGRFIMGGMAILEFFSIFLLSEQVRIIYLFELSLILKRELIIGCDLCACLSIHDVINKLRSFMKIKNLQRKFIALAP